MIQRSTYLNHARNFRHGPLGIATRWMEFKNFLADMGERPAGKTIERVNNNKGYFLGNCVWGTSTEQARNTKSNVNLTYQGKTQCMSAWGEEIGLGVTTLKYRIDQGMTLEEILNPDATHGKGNRRKTHCPAGHPYSTENTYLKNGNRKCKTCNRIRAKALRDSK